MSGEGALQLSALWPSAQQVTCAPPVPPLASFTQSAEGEAQDDPRQPSPVLSLQPWPLVWVTKCAVEPCGLSTVRVRRESEGGGAGEAASDGG